MSDVSAAGLLFSHPSSHEHDPREHLAEHPDTPERIAEIEAALADEDWLGWERRDAQQRATPSSRPSTIRR